MFVLRSPITGMYLRELVSTGSGIRWTKDVELACKYPLLAIAAEDAAEHKLSVIEIN